jgi:hypothetical protein
MTSFIDWSRPTREKRLKFYVTELLKVDNKKPNLARYYRKRIIKLTRYLDKHPKFLTSDIKCACKECIHES